MLELSGRSTRAGLRDLVEKTIQEFIDFMEENDGGELHYDTGILINKGCDGEFGSCCAKQIDLCTLASTLEELVKS